MADHHFVPQFYLRQFLDPASVGTPDPWVWVADLEPGEVSRRAPRNLANRAGYYSSPGGTTVAETEAVERLFSHMETAAAPIVRNLNRGDDTLTPQEWSDLLYFAAFLAVRTPSVRDNFEQFFSDVAEMMLRVSASHPAHFAETWQKANPDRTLTPEEIEQARQQLLKKNGFKIRAQPILSLQAAFDGAKDTIYPVFMQMPWVILRPSTADSFFLTSDTPVGWVDPTPRPAFYSGHGLAMTNVEVSFPVGPRVCLFAGRKLTPGMGALAVEPHHIEQLNTRRVIYSGGQVYAHQEALAQWAVDFSVRHRDAGAEPGPSL
jgi:hypothetical protein